MSNGPCKGVICGLVVTIVLMPAAALIAPTAAGGGDSPTPSVERLEVDARVQGCFALTTVYTTIENPTTEPYDRSFTFRIPEHALISNFSITVGDKTLYADVIEARDAQQRYDNAVREGRAAGLLASAASRLFSYSLSVPPGSSISASLRYEEVLLRTNGEYTYDLFLTGDADPMPIGTLDVSIDIASEGTIDRLETTGYESELVMASTTPYRSTVGLHLEEQVPCEDLRVVWATEPGPRSGRMYFYEDGDEGYFLHVLDPSPDEFGGALKRDIILILDRSGSMSGGKLGQAKNALVKVIDNLGDEDRFGIIAFDTQLVTYSGSLEKADSDGRRNAKQWVDNIQTRGGTDIHSALIKGIEMIQKAKSEVPIIVLLTDGQANTGVYHRSQLRKEVQEKNTVDAVINTVAIGSDADWTFLEALALENHGRAVRLGAGEKLDDDLKDFIDGISRPVLSDVVPSYEPAVLEVDPLFVRGHYAGSEVLFVGRYVPGTPILRSSVAAVGKDGSQVLSGDFPIRPDAANAFVARCYAYMRIKALEERIKWNGSDDATVRAIVDLGVSYHFVTSYTSLFVELPVEAEEWTENPMATTMPSLSSPAPYPAMSAADESPGLGSFWVIAAIVAAAAIAVWRLRSRRRNGAGPL